MIMTEQEMDEQIELMKMMRNATEEEVKSVYNYIDSISEPLYTFTDEEMKSYEYEIRTELIEKISIWVKEQSRILKRQSDDFNDEECFGGWRAMEDVLRYLAEQLKEKKNE